MLKLKNKRPLWSSAVFLQEELALPPHGAPEVIFACRPRPRHPTSPHTKADPFLFEYAGKLFLFIETQALDDPGRIEMAEIGAGVPGELKPVLEEPFHVSYPHVFEMGGEVFMLPETQASGEVRLYKFDSFPDKLHFYQTLLTGAYTDPSPIFIDGMWYLFLTSSRGLELFYTADLLKEKLKEHPNSPITSDASYSRCAGVPFFYRGDLIRPAQECSRRYGENVNLARVDIISPSEYRETPVTRGLLSGDQRWNTQGGHHIHFCQRASGRYAVGLDGQAPDSITNKVIARVWMKSLAVLKGQ